MKIVFYCKESAEANIDNYLELGVSGTVSAMILAAHGLTGLGHEVVVLNRSRDGVFQGTRHIHTEAPQEVSAQLVKIGPVDFFIANGWAGDVFQGTRLNAGKRVHWLHNFCDQRPFECGVADGRIDYGVCISVNQLGTWWRSPAFSRVTNIPNCVDTLNLGEEALVEKLEDKIMFIGATRESKGFHDALRVFLAFHVRHPQFKFYVAGGANLHHGTGGLSQNGIFEAEYEDRCLKNLLYNQSGALREEIVLLGRISRRQVLAHLRTTRVALVNPSWTSEPETYCVSAVEAQGIGVPVISTFRGGLPEVILDGRSGILVKSKSDLSMVAAIERITEDERLAAEFAGSGRANVMEKFGVSRIASEWDAKLRVMTAGKLFRGNMLKAIRSKIRHKVHI